MIGNVVQIIARTPDYNHHLDRILSLLSRVSNGGSTTDAVIFRAIALANPSPQLEAQCHQSLAVMILQL